jgi:hypothetical protein
MKRTNLAAADHQQRRQIWSDNENQQYQLNKVTIRKMKCRLFEAFWVMLLS